MKKTAEREKMLDYIDQQENGGAAMPSSNRSLMAGDPNSSQQMDPVLQQEIATKKQYIDKLRN